MKKLACLLLLVCLLPVVAMADDAIKMGYVDYAAHGNQGFAVTTVALQGDTIVGAKIDEFQFMPADGEGVVGVPNSDGTLGGNFPEGQVLASKRASSDYYSALMTDHAGATVAIAANYDAIEAYAVGKTVAELEAELEGATAEAMIDAVSGATLADTMGYLNGILAAAKAAK